MPEAEWKVIELQLNEELQALLDSTADFLEQVVAFLDLIAVALDVVAAVAQAALDAYVTLVNALIDEVQAFIQDLRTAGIYVLLDAPLDIQVGELTPVSETSLAGTVFSPGISADDLHNADGDELVALANRRKSWSRRKKSTMSFDDAIGRVVSAFSDPLDHLRPQVSESAATYGVVIMAYSTEAAAYLKAVRQLTNIFAVGDLLAANYNGLDGWIDGVSESLDEMAERLGEVDFCEINLLPSFTFRNAGKQPNFIGRYTLEDLFPALGQALQELSNLIELLRPNGSLTDFIQGLIEAIQAKAERFRQLAETLAELAETLRNLSGTKLTCVAIESTTGNNGFVTALRNATGAPQFEEALVATLVLYATGPNAEPLRLMFGVPGDAIDNTYQANLDREANNDTRRIVPP